MKTKFYFLAALATAMFASCANDEFVGDTSPTAQEQTAGDGSIQFTYNLPNRTRAGELTGATAAEKLGGMFVVEGTKGSEAADAPSSTVVFDNYLVGYEYNSAGTTESNTHNWEYVGKQTGITGRMTADTWTKLHPSGAQEQSIKYWDYSTAQYDFIAWSTGGLEAVPVPASPAVPDAGTIQVSRIYQVTTAEPTGFTMRARSADDLKKCYYTDINKVLKTNYGAPVTLTFRNMTAKVRIALYETVPGYSVKSVEFFQQDDETNPAAPTDLATDISTNPATLFTTGGDKLPQSGTVTVLYPRVGSGNNTKADYNKASVTVAADASTVTTQEFGSLSKFVGKDRYEADAQYLGRTLPTATFAGNAADDYYKAVIPNTNGKPLTLRVNYTLVATDGSGETIKVYGAKAAVPATYTKWLPNYAYTYIFKISDNSNGWTSTTSTDPKGLFPITFDAVVTNFVDVNAEQTTVTTVATPSITTYQQGHDNSTDEYSKNQKAGADNVNVKKLYVQVMDNSGATPSLKGDLGGDNKSLLFSITKGGVDYNKASEAEVMDALQNRTSDWDSEHPVTSPVGRNGITLTTNANILNNVTSIVNDVNDQPITVSAGQAAEIAIASLATGTYAYVYCTTVPSTNEKIYNVVSDDEASTDENYKKYYEVELAGTESVKAAGSKAAADKVYFVKNVDAEGHFVSYTFKQTKVNDDVEGLVEASIGASTATAYHADSDGHYFFYFDVYNQNNGAYAVKVIKVVD